MKKIAFFLVAAVVLCFGSTFLEYFTAKSENENIKLEWKTADENSAKEFVIERKSVRGNFMAIATIPAKGSNSIYSYLDQNMYKASGLVYIYRLRITENDYSASYSKEISVTHSLSDFRKTWGSIKAMFR